MSYESGNQPAFQTPHVWAERWEMIDKIKDSEGGLTKREYFAGLAMQGLACNVETALIGTVAMARASIEMADTLLAELDETP